MRWHFLLKIPCLYNYLLSKKRKEYDLLLLRNKYCWLINKFHKNGEFKNRFYTGTWEIADDRTLLEKVCLLIQVDMPFLYAKVAEATLL